jgi:hypothetical protein
MNSRLPAVLCFLFLSAFAAEHARAAASTTFVASNGVDSNTSVNCARATPCRTFGASLSVTVSGGEVIVVDSEDYGPASITQSVSIIAPDGVYAGVKVLSGTGISISGSGLTVTLRGLTFEGPGLNSGSKFGAAGLLVNNFNGSLFVQRSNFSGFSPSVTGTSVSGGFAIHVVGNTGTGRVQAQFIDTAIHDSTYGIALVGSVTASISHVKLFNLGRYGVYVADGGYGEADVSVSDTEWSAPSLSGGIAFEVVGTSASAQLYIDHTVMTGGGNGVYAESAGALAYVTMTNSLLSKIGTGLTTVLNGGGGAAEITFSGSTINANSCGASNASGGTLITAGSNLFIGNGSNVAGSLTQVATQ